MRIVLDMQGCQSESRYRGIGRYTLALSQAIARNAGKHEIFLLLNKNFPDAIEPIQAAFSSLVPLDQICLFEVPPAIQGQNPPDYWRASAAELIRERYLINLQPDIVYVMSLFEGYVDDAVTSIGHFDNSTFSAATLYDLIPLVSQEIFFCDAPMRNWYFRKLQSLKRANLILAISESSKREGIERLSLPAEQIFTISAAADSIFYKQPISLECQQKLMQQHGIHKPFLLYVGLASPLKHITNLITAYAGLPGMLRQQYQLVIVAKMSFLEQQQFMMLQSRVGLVEVEVVFTGFVADQDLVVLYNSCFLFVFLSLHEGFGFPALEAMACGAPVIASNATSLPEMLGCEDALFDPNRPQAITEMMVKVLTNPDFRKNLISHAERRAQQFSWDSSATKALTAFEETYQRFKNEQSVNIDLRGFRQQPTLAFVSPLPPEKTGIADYSSELLPELSRFYDITVIVDQAKVDDPWVQANFKIRSSQWFELHAPCFDRIVYHLGNSHFHQHMFSLLKQHSGTVVLHDFYLNHLMVASLENAHFLRLLYQSHGYSAVVFDKNNGRRATVLQYPNNKQVFDLARGVIVHSSYAVQLAKKWCGVSEPQKIAAIPLLRGRPPFLKRSQARRLLGINAKDFVVCSFGFLGELKLNERLLNCWLRSSLLKDKECSLIFVGQSSCDEYEKKILSIINKKAARHDIRITGFVTMDIYRAYLVAADMAVQLRKNSRGENSGAILDCLVAGLPLIVNAHGSNVELPDDALIKLDDDFADQALISALERLHQDKKLRLQLAAKASEYAVKQHHPRKIAERYVQVIEQYAKSHSCSIDRLLLDSVTRIGGRDEPTKDNLLLTAQAIAANRKREGVKQLLVDVSSLVWVDIKTGIQRCVRGIALALLYNPPPGFRVELVFADDCTYRYARSFTLAILDLQGELTMPDERMESYPGDVFLGLDLATQAVINHQQFLQTQKLNNVKTFFMVFDLLPILCPQFFIESFFFKQWLVAVSHIADGLVCISESVVQELAEWLEGNPTGRLQPLAIDYVHLGSDILASLPTRGWLPNADEVMAQLSQRPTCLMVGTLEPRKGHAQALAAFEQLWRAGYELNLVIVGKVGWMVDTLLDDLTRHPENGKRLFWLKAVSDEMLEKIYANSSFLLAASYAEGFGLPLIEAAQHRLAILARDIAVFREVAGTHAAYFQGESPELLASAILNWLQMKEEGTAPQSEGLPRLTWSQVAQRLVSIVLSQKPPHTIYQPGNGGAALCPKVASNK